VLLYAYMIVRCCYWILVMSATMSEIDMRTNTTISAIARAVGVTTLTVHNWRLGSQRYRPMPAAFQRLGKSRRLYFSIADVTAWLKEYRPDLLKRWNLTHDQGCRKSPRVH
jgi:hypothetical protein